jgi:hypothetical protein
LKKKANKKKNGGEKRRIREGTMKRGKDVHHGFETLLVHRELDCDVREVGIEFWVGPRLDGGIVL